MKIAVLSCILGNFDKAVPPSHQNLPYGDEVVFHCFTDEDFPPITGLTPRLQYRIPKLFGWQMLPGFDVYIWHDGVFSLQNPDSVAWFLDQLGDAEVAFFKHPNRSTIKQEVDHIEERLQRNDPYITPRYKNGLHKEQLAAIYEEDPDYEDNALFASTCFVYRDTPQVREFMKAWWYHQSRYFTCDQVVLPWLLWNYVVVNTINENQYKIPYLTEVSKHK